MQYTGSRIASSTAYKMQIRHGRRIPPSDLDIWLTGRWRVYTRHLGRLFITPVEHEPWPLREATVDFIEQNVTDSIGLDGLTEPAMVHYSRGVHRVRIGPPEVLRRR